MISEVGLFFIILSMITSSLSFLIPILGYSEKLSEKLKFQEKISECIFLFTLLSFICLSYSFLISDFSLIVISSNSNSQLPLIYKFTGVWGNHEGSILLWLLVMTFFGFFFSKHKMMDLKFKKDVLKIQSSLCFLVSLFVVLTSNPFEKNFPPAIEGADLNPLLQDPGLAIHPPFLYLGYVGFSIVYSIALGALLSKNRNLQFIEILKPWVFISWVSLNCGIGRRSLGGFLVFRGGGFWFWDPVENASLLPWLTSSALLHTIVMAEKKKKFLNWTLILSIITFLLSLLGTFLVRSGVLVSVHAFANDPTRGVFILILLSLISGFGLYLFLKKHHIFSLNNEINLISREGAISLNNIFMLSISFTILLGTIYPLFANVFFNTKISVGAPFFNSVLSPILIPMVLGMIFGPYLKWGKDDIKKLLNRLKTLLLIFLILSIFVWYLNYKGPVISLVFFILAVWIIASSFFEFFNVLNSNIKKKIPLKVLAQITAHIGVGLLMIGATGSSILKEERIQFQNLGEIVNIKKFQVKFLGIKDTEGPNYLSQMGFFEISKDNVKLKILKPEKRFYNANKQVTTEAAIHSTILGDLYIAIGDKSSSTDSDAWTTRIWFNPFTIWIWIGVGFLVFGGGISLINSLKFRK